MHAPYTPRKVCASGARSNLHAFGLARIRRSIKSPGSLSLQLGIYASTDLSRKLREVGLPSSLTDVLQDNDSFQGISFKLLLAYFSYIFIVVCLLHTISEKEVKGSTLLILFLIKSIPIQTLRKFLPRSCVTRHDDQKQ